MFTSQGALIVLELSFARYRLARQGRIILHLPSDTRCAQGPKLRRVSHSNIRSSTNPSKQITDHIWHLEAKAMYVPSVLPRPSSACVSLKCLMARWRPQLTSMPVVCFFGNTKDVDFLCNGDRINNTQAAFLLKALVACLILCGKVCCCGHEDIL